MKVFFCILTALMLMPMLPQNLRAEISPATGSHVVFFVKDADGAGAETDEKDEKSGGVSAGWIFNRVLLPAVAVVLAVMASNMRKRFDKSRIAGVRFNGNRLVYIGFILAVIMALIIGGFDVLPIFIPALISIICYTIIAYIPVEAGEETPVAVTSQSADNASDNGFDKEGTKRDFKYLAKEAFNFLFGQFANVASGLKSADRTVKTVDLSTGNTIHKEQQLDTVGAVNAFMPLIIVVSAIVFVAIFAGFMFIQLMTLLVSLIPIAEFCRNYKKYRAAMPEA